ncbi:MAG TPA: hypothetical protein VGC39_10820 [Candidatus Methylacidiphilales bacterium]
MKNILQRNKRGLLMLGLAVFFVLGGSSQSWAYDHHNGGWDNHHRYHHYGYYHHHRGYWDQRNGLRVWINI